MLQSCTHIMPSQAFAVKELRNWLDSLTSYVRFSFINIFIVFLSNNLMYLSLKANMGGLLGLFMGFSVISVIEMFYFISIRPYCNHLRLSQRRRKIIGKIVQKMENLRQRKTSPIIIRTVQTNSIIEKSYPFMN